MTKVEPKTDSNLCVTRDIECVSWLQFFQRVSTEATAAAARC